ncbi:Ribonuclease P protein component [Thermodesulfobacterium geofontis OPF15]|uniref:Ribonuclease P protein component n=1 Tax=Thermodesulfobacterium geofontis (strain OPF15) TaxID=795359 RepID=F8C4M4_THEGP|nr:ribonuclease P protein component [Thermodesulfobacterium geofontis]AEH22690.1 Ribonuclease P protein component [Thermodesulfobacterium geofontis OPF15]
MKKEGLSSKERLRKDEEFQAVFREGKKVWIDAILLIIYKPNDFNYRRLGIIVSKKIKKATQRNRVKRLIREFFRRNKDLFPENCDIIIIPHPNLLNFKYRDFVGVVKEKLLSLRKIETSSHDKKIDN